MSTPNRTLADVNALLLQQLYDGIGSTTESSELLEFTEAVAKLNASSRNNDQLTENIAKEEERQAQEDKEMFSQCAEGEVVDASFTETTGEYLQAI